MIIKIAPVGKDPTLNFAADELHRYIKMIDPETDIMITNTEADAPPDKESLRLCCGSCCAELPAVENASLDDGIYISVKNGVGVIAGTNPRAALIAVYRFLRECGCAWIRAGEDGEVIPFRDMTVVSVKVKEAASYRHRAVCIEGAVSYDNVLDTIKWLPKAGMSGYFVQFLTPMTFFERWYRHFENDTLPAQKISKSDVFGMIDKLVDEMKLRGLMYHNVGHGWTCEPFGLEGLGWDDKVYEIPESAQSVFAEVDGKRAIWGGIPLNTNLCYSNTRVRQTVINAIADYCEKHSSVDYLHFWLADGSNNHCECDGCKDTLPSDFYVLMLNELDELMTARGIDTKVVFLIYVDLLWEPEKQKINNPDRFTLMFAPITRTYSKAFADYDKSRKVELAPYVRNKLEMPDSVEENILRLKKWEKAFKGDSFDFDYHFMWDHFLDPGYYEMARILTEDMKGLAEIGLNGMVSCQNQRVYFPTGLGMHMMAEALWNNKVDFKKESEAYFESAFGAQYQIALDFCKKMSELFYPPSLRYEKTMTSEENAVRWAKIEPACKGLSAKFKDAAKMEDDPAIQQSWMYLSLHVKYCVLLSRAFLAIANASSRAVILRKWEAVKKYMREIEPLTQTVFDLYEFTGSINARIQFGLRGLEKKNK